MKGSTATSGERWHALNRTSRAPPPVGDLPDVPLDGAGPGEQPPIHLIEIIVGRVEHEAAGNADGNADGVAVVFNDKTLPSHGTLLLANSGPRPPMVGLRRCSPS